MKIKTISISGYRSINDTLTLEFGNINALVGPNNAGKSNILNAINTVLGRDWITVNNFGDNDVFLNSPDRDIEITIEFQEPIQYHQYKGIDPIPIPTISFLYTRYKIGPNAGQRRLEKKCLNTNGKQVQVYAKKPKTGEQRQYQPLTSIPQDIHASIPLIHIGSNRNLKSQLPSGKYSLLGKLLEDINSDFQNPSNTIVVQDKTGKDKEVPRIERFNQCIKAAIESLSTEEYRKLEKTINDNALAQLGIDPDDKDQNARIYFSPLESIDFYKSLNILVEENGFSINATELGGGFQNALVIAILKAFEERKKSGAVLLIEEPEMFLHPQMQRSLYKTLRNIGETNQIIYTTHSPHFVTIPEYDEIILITKDKNGTKRTKSNLKKTTELDNKLRKELDPERNELFFANRILLVEGDTEKMALPEYAIRESLDIDKAGGTIIEVSGKRNLVAFADLIVSFNIPLGILYDTDSSDFNKEQKEDEKKYNTQLEGYADKGVKVWYCNSKYEDELQNSLTEAVYQSACQKHSGVTKAVRARLIAADKAYSVPEFVKPIVYWLANKKYDKE